MVCYESFWTGQDFLAQMICDPLGYRDGFITFTSGRPFGSLLNPFDTELNSWHIPSNSKFQDNLCSHLSHYHLFKSKGKGGGSKSWSQSFTITTLQWGPYYPADHCLPCKSFSYWFPGFYFNLPVYNMACRGSEKSIDDCPTTKLYYDANCIRAIEVGCYNQSECKISQCYT